MLNAVFALSVYGSDSTIDAFRSKLPSQIPIFEHGHGFGAAYLGEKSLSDERKARTFARRFALDIAAYDQRGCLSPHAIFVQESAAVNPVDFTNLLVEELSALSDSLPRGILPLDAGAAQIQWRGVALSEGILKSGHDFAVACPDNGHFRPSPGFRNVQVLPCKNIQTCVDTLSPFGDHLKAFGSDLTNNAKAIASILPSALRPSLSEIGSMQTPPLDARADGEHPWSWLRPD